MAQKQMAPCAFDAHTPSLIELFKNVVHLPIATQIYKSAASHTFLFLCHIYIKKSINYLTFLTIEQVICSTQ